MRVLDTSRVHCHKFLEFCGSDSCSQDEPYGLPSPNFNLYPNSTIAPMLLAVWLRYTMFSLLRIVTLLQKMGAGTGFAPDL